MRGLPSVTIRETISAMWQTLARYEWLLMLAIPIVLLLIELRRTRRAIRRDRGPG